MSYDQDQDYKDILEFLRQRSNIYHQNPIGFTNFEGSTEPNQVGPRQCNTIIALLVKICQKLDTIEQRLEQLESNKIDEIGLLRHQISDGKLIISTQKKKEYSPSFVQIEQAKPNKEKSTSP